MKYFAKAIYSGHFLYIHCIQGSITVAFMLRVSFFWKKSLTVVTCKPMIHLIRFYRIINAKDVYLTAEKQLEANFC